MTCNANDLFVILFEKSLAGKRKCAGVQEKVKDLEKQVASLQLMGKDEALLNYIYSGFITKWVWLW